MLHRNINYQTIRAGMKVILLAVVAAILAPIAAKAGDAPPDKPAPKAAAKKSAPAKPDGRRTIGVISEIGNSFSVRKSGLEINEEDMVPVENWGLDALVAAKVGAILKDRFNVIPIKLSKAGKAALAEAPSPLTGALFGGRAEYICNVLRKETHAQSFNYFLHVTNMKSPVGLRKKNIVGLGIVNRLGFHQDFYVHAVILLVAMDGATCETLKSDAPEGKDGFLSRPFYGPHREVDRSWFPAPSNVAQNTRLRDATRELVEQGLEQSIPGLFRTAAQ
jgi:hypothetical protein